MMPFTSFRSYIRFVKSTVKDVASDFIGKSLPDEVGGAYARLARQLNEPPALMFPKSLKVSKEFFTSDIYLRQQDRADWQNVDYRIREFAGRYIAEMRRLGIPMFVIWAFRTPFEQAEAVSAGTSYARGIRAPHVQGKAVDIVHSVLPYKLTRAQYAMMGAVGYRIAAQMGIAVKWGGEFTRPYDPCHWELLDWRDDIRQLDVSTPLRITATALLNGAIRAPEDGRKYEHTFF